MFNNQKNVNNHLEYLELNRDINDFEINYSKTISRFFNSPILIRAFFTIVLVYYYRHKCYTNLNKLAKFLKKKTLFHEEYFIFLEIQEMIKYILDKDFGSVNTEELNFIHDLSSNFFKLLQDKINILRNNNWVSNDKFEKEFQHNQESFQKEFNGLKETFYEMIYKENEDNPLIIEYCKIIGE